MPAVKHNLYIEQGATFKMSFTWNQAATYDPTQPGDPIDLTGYTARMQIRKNQQSPTQVDATDANGKIALGGTTGRITVTLSASDTDGLNTRAALYDLEVQDSTGVVTRLLQGTVTVDPNITQTAGQVVPT